MKSVAKLVLSSAGCKSFAIEEPPTYTLPKADVYLDCRGAANPCHGGPSGSGDSPEVQAYVEANTDVDTYVDMIFAHLVRIPTRRKGQGDPWIKPIHVLCFCAHGIHRSRAMKHILARRLKASGWNVEVM